MCLAGVLKKKKKEKTLKLSSFSNQLENGKGNSNVITSRVEITFTFIKTNAQEMESELLILLCKGRLIMNCREDYCSSTYDRTNETEEKRKEQHFTQRCLGREGERMR